MHIVTRATGCAAMGIFVVSCASDSLSNTSSTSAGSTGTESSGTGSSGTGGSAAAGVVDMFCKTLAKPFCDANFACCTSVTALLGHWRDQCEPSFLSGYDPICGIPMGLDAPFLVASLEAGTTIFDQAQFDACLTLFKSMSDGGAACVEPAPYAFSTLCLGVFHGQIAPGDACSTSPIFTFDGYATFPCKDGRCEKGKCLPFLRPGDTCSRPVNYIGIEYAANTICNYLKQETCRGAPVPGDGGGDVIIGACGPQGEIGDACHPGNIAECKSLNCDATGKCAVPDPDGGACL